MTSISANIAAWKGDCEPPGARVADLLCDRHPTDAIAFTFVDPESLSGVDMTYGELSERSARLASGLAARGVAAGDRVPVLMGKRPELVIAAVALWRLGAVYVPLFTAFATGAIELRVSGSQAELVLTEPSQRAKLDPISGIDVLETGPEFDALIARSEPCADAAAVGGDGVMIQLFTSGTTGKPKGVPVPVRALASFQLYLHYGVDVRAEDVFCNAADPGWAYGLYYGIAGPLAMGRRNLLVNGGFTPEGTAAVIRRFGVTNFAGAPTMYRALSKGGHGDGLELRSASSAGEPLTPDVVAWGRERLGVEVRDHYGQTEIGMVAGNACNDDIRQPLKEGSMGQAFPGFSLGIVDGEIAVDRKESELMWFTGYIDDAPTDRFTPDGKWYLTSDTATVDEDGYFFFTARNDDVILAAGYRIGPFDVESVLITHAAVADVAVVGRPDPDGVRGEMVAAYVVLVDGAEGSDELTAELQALVRDVYSRHAYPRLVSYVDALPKTPSGKVQRYLLREAR